jgi:hypothetical protein
MDHHIGLVERAARLQCQKLRIARARADEGDVAGARRPARCVGQQVVERGARGGLSAGFSALGPMSK